MKEVINSKYYTHTYIYIYCMDVCSTQLHIQEKEEKGENDQQEGPKRQP